LKTAADYANRQSPALKGLSQEPNLAFQLTPSDGARAALMMQSPEDRDTEHSARARIGAAELHVSVSRKAVANCDHLNKLKVMVAAV